MERRPLVPVGYRTYTGYRMNQYDADRYNRIQGRINASIDAGIPVSESLLDESHQTFVYIAEAERQEKAA